MTDQEKLKKIEDTLLGYQGDETVFAQPAEETEQQKKFREDLHTVVSILFGKDLNTSVNLSIAEIKARMQKIWQETKPEGWK